MGKCFAFFALLWSHATLLVLNRAYVHTRFSVDPVFMITNFALVFLLEVTFTSCDPLMQHVTHYILLLVTFFTLTCHMQYNPLITRNISAIGELAAREIVGKLYHSSCQKVTNSFKYHFNYDQVIEKVQFNIQ